MMCPRIQEIIHLLKLMDYLLVKADKPWYNCYLYLRCGDTLQGRRLLRHGNKCLPSFTGSSYKDNFCNEETFFFFFVCLVFMRSPCVLRRDWSTRHRGYEKSTFISAEHEIYLLVNVKKMLKCQPLLVFQYL